MPSASPSLELTLSELFATQVMTTNLDAQVDRQPLIAIVERLRARVPEMVDYRTGYTQANTWHSRVAGDNVLLEHREFQKLADVFRGLIEHYLNLLVEVHSGHEADVEISSWTAALWATVSEHGGFQYPHNHPQGRAMSAYSVVYYPTLGDRGCGGDSLVLQNPIEVSSYLNSRMLGRLGVDCAKPQHVHVADGDAVVFPSWLRHSTEPYLGRAPRIAVAYNLAIGDVENRKFTF